MPKMYAMRRANGEIFTYNSLVAVWTSTDALDRSRVRNPELDLYRPLAIDRRTADKIKAVAGDKDLWLVEPETNNADLFEGRRINWSEINKLQIQDASEPPSLNAPKVRATVQELQVM